MDIKVSIIVPVYNNEEYLPQCLDSIRAQTLREIEVIVVNDGSKDASLSIMQSYAAADERFHVIDKPNAGYGDSMNRGLAAAKGEYIGIVESDDFIAPEMYADLYALSRGGTVDVVKGNFYDYYRSPEGEEKITPSKDRDGVPTSKEPFTLRDNGEISWCHPSVWSAIYRRAFLREHDIHFIEARGGGWVDNPFFYETLGRAESIMWTQKPYYYYRRDNPDSSSNHQSDVRLPFRRMLDNLDVLEANGYHYDKATNCAHGRAFLYLTGVLKDFDVDANEQAIAEAGAAVMRRLDPEILREFNLNDQSLYYTYASPVRRFVAGSHRLLLYSGHPYAEKSAAAEDCRALIQAVLKARPDLSIYVLSSGHSYDATRLETYARKVEETPSSRLHIYEIVNGPVPAESRYLLKNPTVTCESQALRKTIGQFLKDYGPFDAVHFLGTAGLSADVLSLKKDHPATYFLLSLHDLLQEKTGGSDQPGSRAHTLYKRGKASHPGKTCCTESLWRTVLQLDRLDQGMDATENVQQSWMIASGEHCDTLISSSEEMAVLAKERGFAEDRLVTIPNGTKNALYQLGHLSAPTQTHLLKLAALAYDEASYLSIVPILLSVPEKAAGRIDLCLVLPQCAGAEKDLLRARYHTLTCKEKAVRMDLPSLLHGYDLALTAQDGTGAHPWTAATAIACGVPVLMAGADTAGKIAGFASNLTAIKETMTLPKLPTLPDQASRLATAYRLPALPDTFTLSPEDLFYLEQEHDFLLRQIREDIANGARVQG